MDPQPALPPNPLKWVVFAVLAGFHLLVLLLGLAVGSAGIIIVTGLPAILLGLIGLRLDTCASFICVPSTAGMIFSGICWLGIYYLVAAGIGRLLPR